MDVTGTLFIHHFMKYSVKWTTSIDERYRTSLHRPPYDVECLVTCTILTDASHRNSCNRPPYDGKGLAKWTTLTDESNGNSLH